MSNAQAVSVLSHLTSYYELTSNWTDGIGTNVALDTVIVTGGSIGAGKMAATTRGELPLATAIPFGPNTGRITLGVVLYWNGGTSGDFTVELSQGAGSATMCMGLVTSTGQGQVQGYGFATVGPTTGYGVSSSGNRKSYYPITVRAADSIGQTADSDQVIAIDRGASPSVPFLAILTWNEGVFNLYLDASLQSTLDVPATVNTSITMLQIGTGGPSPATSICAMRNLFFMANHAMTQAEINYFYNYGTVKTLAQITADAA